MVKALSRVTQAISAVNYYRAFGELVTNSAGSKRFFRNQAAGDVRNDLGVDGYLPDNKSGLITGIFVRCRVQPIGAGTPAVTAGRQMVELLEWLRDCDVAIKVNGTEVVRQPVWACAHPPSWYQGSPTQGTASDGGTFSGQNAGFMLAFTPHEVFPRQTVEVEIIATTAGPSIALANYVPAPSAANRLPIEVTLQVSDKKAV